MAPKKILLIVNSKSGNNSKSGLKESFIDYTSSKNYISHILFLDHDPKNSIQKTIQSFAPDVIITAGGDGTVNLVASFIKHTDIQLIIFPHGSANGMAKDLKMPADFNQCLALIEKGKSVKLDILKINNETSVHLADVGLNARIVKRFQLDNKRGMLTYAKYLFNELFYINSKYFTIKYADKVRKVKAVSLTFANATRYGTGAVINPEGKINDGLFEICIVKPFPKINFITIALQMFRNRLSYSRFFETIQCKKAIVSSKRKTLLQIDGEVIGKVNRVELECIPAAINVVIPTDLDYPTLIN